VGRLAAERKQWRKEHPHGFWWRPTGDPLVWEAGIPGPLGTSWATGCRAFRVRIRYANYPSHPPLVHFDPPIFHPNVLPSGRVGGVPLLDDHHFNGRWHPTSVSMPDILMAIRDLLEQPSDYCLPWENPRAARLYLDDRASYEAQAVQSAVNLAV
jgi:ubiquitin-conjugating enzyme E2 I